MTANQTEVPRVLIIEPNPAVAIELIHALCGDQVRIATRGSTIDMLLDEHEPRHAVVSSLRDLHEHSLEDVDMVVTASSLPDGSALDVLAFLRGAHPHIPVIVAAAPSDVAVAPEAIQLGALDFIVTTTEALRSLPLAIQKALVQQRIKDDNDRLGREVSRSLALLEVRNRELQEVVDQLERMARTDGLTGLANRRWLNIMLAGHWADATRNGFPLAFLMIDLDGFKALNDEQGHQVGDEILMLTARVLEANCREIDIPARFGGDEFSVLMCHADAEQAVHVARRLCHEFHLATRHRKDVAVTMSVGIAHVDVSRPVNAEQLVRHADQALYAAKVGGRNRIMMRGPHESVPPEQVTGR